MLKDRDVRCLGDRNSRCAWCRDRNTRTISRSRNNDIGCVIDVTIIIIIVVSIRKRYPWYGCLLGLSRQLDWGPSQGLHPSFRRSRPCTEPCV